MWLNVNSFATPVFFGDYGKSTKKKLATFKNCQTFQNVFMEKLGIGTDERYDIEGLLPTMSKRVVLESLVWNAGVVFFDKSDSLFALPAVPSGDGFNVNGDPGSAWIFSKNGIFNEECQLYLPGSDEAAFLRETNAVSTKHKIKGVYVCENYQRYPFINHIIWYAEKISDTMRTLDVCRKNIKNPYIITAEESVVPTVKKYFEDRDNNEEYIISSGIFDATKVSVIPLVTNSDTLSSCTELIEWYESKFREICGIDNNAQMDKKGENLIQAEVSVNDMYTNFSVDKCIECINEGLDNVNKIFGTSIKCVKKEHKKDDNKTEDIQTDKN